MGNTGEKQRPTDGSGRSKQHRRHLLDIYSRNLTMYESKPGRAFVCPLCASSMPFASPEDIDDRLSLAHVYPAAAGGRAVTLTCRDCNSRFGAAYDAHLADRESWTKWQEGKIPWAGRLRFGEHSLGVNWTKTPKGSHFQVIAKQTRPGDTEAIMRRAGNGSEFTVTIQLPHPRRQRMALIHSAFLALFRLFGYEYALSPAADRMRHLLQGAALDHPVVEQAVGRMAPATTASLPIQPGRSYVVTSPPEVRAFAVIFPHAREGAYWSVLMPGFGVGEWEHYESCCRLNRGARGFGFSPLPVPDERRLTESTYRMVGHALWRSHYAERHGE